MFHKFKEGDEVIYDGYKTVILDVIDEITVEILIWQKTCYTRPKATFMNKIWRLIGFPLDLEIVHDAYQRPAPCSVWNMKPVTN